MLWLFLTEYFMYQVLMPVLTQHPLMNLGKYLRSNRVNLALQIHSRICVCPKETANMDMLPPTHPHQEYKFSLHPKQNFQTQIFAKEKNSQIWNTYLKLDKRIPKPLIKML